MSGLILKPLRRPRVWTSGEYLSMIAAKLPKVDENSRAIQERISAIYEQ